MDYENLTKEELVAVLKRRDALARYGLSWESERIEPDSHLNRDFVGLTLDAELSVGEAPWDDLVIEGDNYDALRHLASTHAGKFHLIYIDPPYNTGRQDFVYNDKFFDANNRYRHSTWLEFMFQRLRVARNLLRDDGAIFVSIDDNELPNLWLLMNQVFGEKAFVANCVWQKRYSRENREAIGDAHEYLLIFSPNPDAFKARRGKLPLTDKQLSVYKNPNDDPKGPWRAVALSAQGFRPNQMYPITGPTGKVFTPPEGSCWKVIEPQFNKLKEEGRIYFGKKGDAMPSRIQYLCDIEGVVPWTWWPHEETGHTDEARKEVQAIFGTQTAFDTPKPVRLLERILQIGAPEKDALVLDFFAGSGTTGQAVWNMNRKDQGRRRFVLISSTEATLEAPERNVCRDACRERLKRVSEGYRPPKGSAVEGTGTRFAYLKADPVPMHRLEESLTNEMVWHFALQAAGHPVSPLNGRLAVSTWDGTTVAYCTTTKKDVLDELKALVEKAQGPLTIYAWAIQSVKDALGGALPNVRFVSVPSDLRLSFKHGNARRADPEPGELPA